MLIMTDDTKNPQILQADKSNGQFPQSSEDILTELIAEQEQPLTLFERRFTANDFKQRPAPPEYVVKPLLPVGSLSIVFGESGSKKTWCMLDLAVCVSIGEPWLDFLTIKGPVLIVDEESGRLRLHDRSYRVIRGHFAESADLPIIFFPSNGADFGNPDWVNALHIEIVASGARLVIIDALADVMLGRDENAVKDVLPVLLALRRVAENTGAAIVLVHHTNKVGEYRGSTALKGAIDLMLSIESKPDSPNIDFRTEKSRDTEPLHFAAIFNYNETDQTWLTASESKKTPSLSKSQEYVLRYLAEHGPSELDEIAEHADVCSSRTAENATRAMADPKIGLTYKVNDEAGGRGKKAVFALTEKGKITSGGFISENLP